MKPSTPKADRSAPRPLLSLKEAARRLGVSLRTLRTLTIPRIRISIRRIGIDPSDLEEFIASRRAAGR